VRADGDLAAIKKSCPVEWPTPSTWQRIPDSASETFCGCPGRRGRDHHHDRQEQPPPRGDHSAARQIVRLSRNKPLRHGGQTSQIKRRPAGYHVSSIRVGKPPMATYWRRSQNDRRQSWPPAGTGHGRGMVSVRRSTARRSLPTYPTATSTSTTCAGRQQRGSMSRDYPSGLSPRSWRGTRNTSPKSSGATSAGRRPPKQSSTNSTRPKREQQMQNRLQNRPGELVLSIGAGDGNRTHDIQLGKLSFYH
jgi:hypothetical protein